MDRKKWKLELLLDIYGKECVKLEELPIIVDDKTRKDVDEQYEKVMNTRKKIIDLVFNQFVFHNN